MRTVKKRPPEEYESAGKFLVGGGVLCLALPIFLHADLGSSLRCLAMGLMAVGTGRGMISSARKRKKQELQRAKKKMSDVMPNTALEPTAAAPSVSDVPRNPKVGGESTSASGGGGSAFGR